MRWLRGLGRLVGVSLLAALMAPIVGLVLLAFLDRVPDGPLRWSAFPMALATFDPLVWECARNTVGVAAATTLGSLVLGVGLGQIAGPRRGPESGLLWALCLAPSMLGPLIVVPSLAAGPGGASLPGWVEGRSIFGEPVPSLLRWATLVWAGLAMGVPLVGLTTSRVLGQIDPNWIDSARAIGASRRRSWLDLVWPVLRPEVARTSAFLFAFSLLEPAGPILLRLPRTLAVQIVRASSRDGQPTRASTLALIAVALAVVGRFLIHRWGGPSYVRPDHLDAEFRSRRNFRTASTSRVVRIGWCFATSLPVGLWLFRLLDPSRLPVSGAWASIVSGGLSDSATRCWAMNSLTTAGLSILLDLVLLGILTAFPEGGPIRLATTVFRSVPPLALGVGAIAVPWFLRSLADRGEGSFGPLALELSPGRSPGFLLVLALVAIHWPILASAAEVASNRIRPGRVEASRIMGMPEDRARQGGTGRRLGVVPILPACLAFFMATTSLAPALLLTPVSERRTLAPAVLGILDQAVPLDRKAAGPIALLLGLHLATFLVACRSRDEWPSSR